MGTRHELVQAHRFVTRRIVSALLSGEPETTERPMRRLALSLFGSLLVAAIVFAVIGVYGFLNPAGGRPRDGDLLIMRETGARYTMVDRTLHPILNWTSALLFAGTANPPVRQMSRKSLAPYRVGAPIGIPGAPDPPPARGSLLRLPWTVCSVPGADGAAAPTTSVLVGRAPDGPVAGPDLTLLVATGSGDRYLLWQHRRYRILGQTTMTALELAAIRPIRVTSALLNGVTAGPDLVAPKITDAGKPSGRVINGAQAPLGQVYRSGQTHYVLTQAGLVPVGAVTARLLLVNATQPIEISAADAARFPVTEPLEPANFPTTLPVVSAGQNELSMICAVHRGDERDNQVSSVVGYTAAADSLAASAGEGTGPVGADGVASADRVLVPGGRGALVRAQPAPGVSADTTVYLVTDQGLRFPLRSNDSVNAAAALGYAGYSPVPVPASILSLLPIGPTLDPAAAGQFVPVQPGRSGPAPSATGAATPANPSPSASASPSPSASSGSAGSATPRPGASSSR